MKKPLIALALSFFIASTAWGSPWASHEAYGDKTGGKAVFGLKNLLLGWTAFFTEPVKYHYYLEKRKGWEGLCYGISKSVIYTATGAIQLVTFPIPVDFPNMGEGVLQTSVKDQAEREQGKKKTSPAELAEDAIQSEVNAAAKKDTALSAITSPTI